MSGKPLFFAELKRRNVYKVAVAYAVVGWALAQGIAQVFPVFDIPNWAVRLIVLAIVIGFPIALVIAWAFELMPEEIKRTEDVDLPAGSGSKKPTWIYVAVVGAAFSIGLFFIGRYTARNGSTASPRGSGFRKNRRLARAKEVVRSELLYSTLNAEPWLRGSSVRKRTYLRLVVNGLAFELLPVRVCTVNGDRARFAVGRDRDSARPHRLSILHRGDVVGPIIYYSVSDGVIRQIPFHRVGFPIELADPNAVRRFPILVYALHGDLSFVLLLRVSDRGVFAHPGHELRLRLIELPRAHVRVGRKTSCCCHKRQGHSHYCNSSFYHGAIPAETLSTVNNNSSSVRKA